MRTFTVNCVVFSSLHFQQLHRQRGNLWNCCQPMCRGQLFSDWQRYMQLYHGRWYYTWSLSWLLYRSLRPYRHRQRGVQRIRMFANITTRVFHICMYVCLFDTKKMAQVTEQHQVGHDESITKIHNVPLPLPPINVHGIHKYHRVPVNVPGFSGIQWSPF